MDLEGTQRKVVLYGGWSSPMPEGPPRGDLNRAESTVSRLQAGLSFYAQMLGFEPGDRIPMLEIANPQELTLG